MSRLMTTLLFSALFIITLLAYYPSLSVPFYLDDYESIVNNYFLLPVTWDSLHTYFPLREVGYFTFALNKLADHQVLGFHMTNLILHLLVGVTVFVLSKLILAKAGWTHSKATALSLVAMGFFLLAPINTQAVTYIVQRLASLAALFYALTLVFYLLGRQAQGIKAWCAFLLAVLCFITGIMVKQNIATVPFAILLVELLLLKKGPEKLIPRLLVVALYSFFAFMLLDFAFELGVMAKIDQFARLSEHYSRWQYFTHQLVAIWVYVYKFFIPLDLRFEYGFELYTWQHTVTWLALVGHIFVGVLAYRLRARQPVVALLVCLFYLAHAVESSFIPIDDLMFEHRAYLPNIFLSILVSYTLFALFYRTKIALYLCALFLVLFFSWQTYQRNTLWQEPVEFYRNEMTYISNSARVYSALANAFIVKGDLEKGAFWTKAAMQVGLETQRLSIGSVVQYIRFMFAEGNNAEASRIAVLAINGTSRIEDRTSILNVLAEHYMVKGHCDFALGFINRSLAYQPTNAVALQYLYQCSSKINTTNN